MVCIKCLKEVPEGSLFCNHCGEKLGMVEVTVSCCGSICNVTVDKNIGFNFLGLYGIIARDFLPLLDSEKVLSTLKIYDWDMNLLADNTSEDENLKVTMEDKRYLLKSDKESFVFRVELD